MDWNSLQELYEACRDKQVAFSLSLSYADGSWSVYISSQAPSEEASVTDTTFELAVSLALEHVRSL